MADDVRSKVRKHHSKLKGSHHQGRNSSSHHHCTVQCAEEGQEIEDGVGCPFSGLCGLVSVGSNTKQTQGGVSCQQLTEAATPPPQKRGEIEGGSSTLAPTSKPFTSNNCQHQLKNTDHRPT
jgi:hypothetical protein